MTRPFFIVASALLLLSTGCIKRQVWPSLGGPRAVDTGVPVTFGSEDPSAPELTYEFGDGSPPQTGKLIRHAYARAGSYQVFALHEGQPVDGVLLTAVPRRITRAMPEAIHGAIFLRKVKGNLDPFVDFFERLAGAEAAQAFVEENPLVELGMELSAGQGALAERGIDPEEGLGMFSVPGFEGSVALIGVTEGEKALQSLETQLTRAGTPAWTGSDQTTRVRLKDGREAALFLDRGYLYVALPDTPAPPSEFADPPEDELARDTGMNHTDFTPAVDAVKKAHPLGFEGTGTLAGLEDGIAPGNLYVYAQTQAELAAKEQGAFLSFTFKQAEASVDGFVRAKTVPWSGRPKASFFKALPRGPVAALSASIPPEELATFFFGAPGSEQRVNAANKAKSAGIEFEALLSSLTGDLSAALYFDARAFYTAMAKAQSPRPLPRGSAFLTAGLKDPAAFARFLDALSEGAPFEVKREAQEGNTRYQGVAEGQPFEINVGKDELRLEAGEDASWRGSSELGEQLHARYGADAFGPGHLSVMVDVAQLREELSVTPTVAGVPAGKMQLFQSFAYSFLEQLPPVDQAFLDVAAVQGGAKLRGRVVLRGQ